MKIHYIKSILILSSSLMLASCLKDKAFNNGQIQSGAGANSTVKVVGIGLTVSSTSNFLVASFDNSNTDTTINLIPVTLGATQAAQQDIHVTLTANPQIINDYDTANGTDYTFAPASVFTVLNNGVVTIPKGSYTGYLQIAFRPSNFIGVNYAVAYSITSITEAGYTISGNLKDGMVAIGVKNKFDGQYKFTINTVGWAAYGIADGVPGLWPSNLTLITSGANSVTFSTPEDGPLQPAFTTSGGATGFGNTAPQFTFDPTSNALLSVTNLATPIDSRNRQFAINPAVTTSRFDPATKTIYAAYLMTQNGRPTQYIYDTLVYVKPR